VTAAANDPSANPFALDQPEAYRRWREAKLARFPRRVEELVVPIRDPRSLDSAEVEAIARICERSNMAICSSPLAATADKEIPRRLGEQLGLGTPLANLLADEDAVSSIEAVPGKAGRGYIPYTNRRLLWHTDGYYNAPGETVRAFILHCVRPAARGGETRLLDPEIAYILLRDADPEHVRALSDPRALTIPANEEAPDSDRPARTGPVFSMESGRLHMRYTARVKSIEWAPDAATQSAVRFLAGILESASPWVFGLRLEAGQGLVCNNVLHSRSDFEDPPAPAPGRLVYRARYTARVAAPRSEARALAR
jgi:alpha-ketoglutarate-dependent taurine dioxygenase